MLTDNEVGEPIAHLANPPQRARDIQRQLAPRVMTMALARRPRLIAGADLAFSKDGNRCVACVVIWDVHARRVVEVRYAVTAVQFPYVPGLLSFREGPALLAAFRRVQNEPDVIMLDGHGVAHPRRFGLACHVGLWLNRPTLGCAKSVLVGKYAPPAETRGFCSKLTDGGDLVGMAVRTRKHVQPVFVSVGHRICLADAVKIVLDCGDGYRLPAPTRLADQIVGKISKATDLRLAWKEISAKMRALASWETRRVTPTLRRVGIRLGNDRESAGSTGAVHANLDRSDLGKTGVAPRARRLPRISVPN